jgi:plastocyanin
MPRVFALLALVVLVAACGGGGSSGSQQPASDAKCPAGATVIAMKDIQFHPAKAAVKVGDTVCWTNEDGGVQHDAAADDGAFRSVLFGSGKTFSWKAAKAGKVSYVCTVHPGMTGELDVSG